MCLACQCDVSVADVVRCQLCSSGLYCSITCLKAHRTDHEILCGMIQSLEEIEVSKLYQQLKSMEAGVRESPAKDEIVGLVGERPLVNVCLDGAPAKALWDTGSMIAMMGKKFKDEHLPDKKLHTVSEFLGEKLSISAANNSDIPIEGVVVVDFALNDAKFSVPFLVTRGNMENPIIGTNVMKHLVLNCKDALPSLMELLPGLTQDSAKVLASAIEVQANESEILSEVKLTSNLVIPGNYMVRTQGKTRVELGAEEREVSFSPAADFLGEQELQLYESAARLKGGKSQFINVAVYNPTSEDVFMKKGTVLGHVSEVNTVIQFPVQKEAKVAKVDSVEKDGEDDDEEVGSWEDQLDLSGLTEEEFLEAKQMLLEEHEVFSKSKNDIGHVPDFKIPINLVDDIPVNESYRSIPRPLYEDVKNHINNLLAHGWVRKSTSAYASPMVCARKKDGSLRLCIDFRRLNTKIIPDRQPIPRVQDILDGLNGQEWFSTLDMSQAYHQGEINEESRKFTAFSTPWSLLEWIRIPYGLSNAPPCFQRFINETLRNLKDKICVAYLDDILIFGKNFKEHKRNVRTVIRCLRKKGIKLNPKKCCFFRKEVRYLGRLVSRNGYRPDPENTAALDECLKAPKTISNLRSLLGFLGYYRNFVMNFSRKMKPVYDLLKVEEEVKDKRALAKRKIEWLPEHQRIVEEIVGYLKSPEVIAFPDFKEPFFIHCDASNTGLGGVLYQKQEEKLRVISFASRTLSPAEKNYNLHSGKLEFLALKWCITEKFSDYLHYGPRFTVFTDNNPLTYVLSSAKLNAAGLRWVAQLADYQFDIKYRPGKLNIDADYLSRHPVDVFKSHMEGENELLEAEDVGIIFNEATKRDRMWVDSNSVSVQMMEENKSQGCQKISCQDLQAAQLSDDIIAPVYQAVLANSSLNVDAEKNRGTMLLSRQRKKLFMEKGVLFRRTATNKQIVLPKTFHSMVFKELHDSMRHLGSEKVVDLARRRFYWPYMQRDIEYYVRKQCSCIKSKRPNVPDKAPLVPITSTYPFEMVSMDFLHLDRCKGGYEYALIVCDHFTRYTQIYATKNKSARSAAECIFNKFILQFGLPRRIHHDQGGEFQNRLFARLHQLTGIESSRTTPYHPEGDGQPERMNRTLINMLKCLEESEKKDWSKHLSKLSFAYNSMVNKSTGYSPFYLIYGRDARLPIDWVFGIDLDEASVAGQKSYDQYVKTWNRSMKEAIDIAKKNVSAGQKWNKNAYDRKVKGVQIEVGDKVLMRNREKGGTGKLRSYWEESIYDVIAVDEKIPVITVVKEGSQPKRIHRNNVMVCNELLEAEAQSKSDPETQRNNIGTKPRRAKSHTPKTRETKTPKTETPKSESPKTTKPNKSTSEKVKTQHPNITNQTQTPTQPLSRWTSPVVDYSDSDSDDEMLIVSCKRGEGEREENDLLAVDSDEGAVTEHEVVEDISGYDSVEDDGNEDSLADFSTSTLAYEEEWEQGSEPDVEISESDGEDIAVVSEPESVNEEEEVSVAEDSVSSDDSSDSIQTVRQSHRMRKPPDRYSPSP